MKADIQSQIELINEQIAFPEFFDFDLENVDQMIRRKTFLEHALNSKCSEINQSVINFVYQE